MSVPPPKPRWWRRPLVFSTILALVVHLPLTPLVPILRTLQRLSILREPPKELDEPPDETRLPIELVELPPPPPSPDDIVLPAPGAPPPAAPPARSKQAEQKEEQRRAEEQRKAEEKKAEERRKAEEKRRAEEQKKADKKPSDKGEHPEDEPPDPDEGKLAQGEEGEEAGTQGDKGPKAPRPIGAVGLQGKLDDKVAGKPNVTFALWMGELRAHALGGVVGELIACNREWKPFLQKGIRPFEDLEGMMMVGPQITSSKRATIAVQHRLGGEKVREVFDDLVKRSGKRGKWLEDGVARVVVQRHERVLFEHPRDMVFVAPTDTWRQIHAQTEPLSLPPSRGRTIGLSLLKPGKMLQRFGVELPASISELRLDIFANRDGSFDLQIDLIDRDEASAASHVKDIERNVGQLIADVSQIAQTVTSLAPSSVVGDDLGGFKLPRPDFSPSGGRLTATLRLTASQSGKLLGLLSRQTCPKKK